MSRYDGVEKAQAGLPMAKASLTLCMATLLFTSVSAARAGQLFTPIKQGNYFVCGSSSLPEGITSDLGLIDIDSNPILGRLRKESVIMLLIARNSNYYSDEEVRAIQSGITSRIVRIPSAYRLVNPQKYSKTFDLTNSSGLRIRIRLQNPAYLEDARGYRYNIGVERVSKRLYCGRDGMMMARTVSRIVVNAPNDSYGRELRMSLMYLVEEVGLNRYSVGPSALQSPPWL